MLCDTPQLNPALKVSTEKSDATTAHSCTDSPATRGSSLRDCVERTEKFRVEIGEILPRTVLITYQIRAVQVFPVEESREIRIRGLPRFYGA